VLNLGRVSTLAELLRGGADVTGTDSDDDLEAPLLHFLVWLVDPANARLVPLLVARGADVDARDREGKTPLHVASSKDDVRYCIALLEAGAPTSTRWIASAGRRSITLSPSAENTTRIMTRRTTQTCNTTR
jgi:hypothetical protein